MISSDSKTKKLNINIYEHPEFNLGALDNMSSIVDYDILVWNDYGEILVKKIGKVNKKNLSKSLSFDVPELLNQTVYFSLSLSLVIDGKKTSFVTVSGDNELLNDFILKRVENGQTPYIFTNFYFTEAPKKDSSYTLDIITLEENIFEEVYLKEVGATTIKLKEGLGKIEWEILNAERAIRRLSSMKKQTLGVSVVIDRELFLLETLNKSGVLEATKELVTMYETTGVLGVSEYRQRLYTNLKPVLDNLIIAKGRLEKIIEVLPVDKKKPLPGQDVVEQQA